MSQWTRGQCSHMVSDGRMSRPRGLGSTLASVGSSVTAAAQQSVEASPVCSNWRAYGCYSFVYLFKIYFDSVLRIQDTLFMVKVSNCCADCSQSDKLIKWLISLTVVLQFWLVDWNNQACLKMSLHFECWSEAGVSQQKSAMHKTISSIQFMCAAMTAWFLYFFLF